MMPLDFPLSGHRGVASLRVAVQHHFSIERNAEPQRCCPGGADCVDDGARLRVRVQVRMVEIIRFTQAQIVCDDDQVPARGEECNGEVGGIDVCREGSTFGLCAMRLREDRKRARTTLRHVNSGGQRGVLAVHADAVVGDLHDAHVAQRSPGQGLLVIGRIDGLAGEFFKRRQARDRTAQMLATRHHA